MVDIADLIAIGLKCPNCGGIKIRGGYHDWQHMDSFICELCGLHWQEDFDIIKDLENKFNEPGWRYKERGFIWVMCDSEYPLTPILNEKSADEINTRKKFVKDGIKYAKLKNKR